MRTRRFTIWLMMAMVAAVIALPALAQEAKESKDPKGQPPGLPQGAVARYEMPIFAAIMRDKNGGMKNIHMALSIFFSSQEAQFAAASRAPVINYHIILDLIKMNIQEFDGDRGKKYLKKVIEDILKEEIGEKDFHSFEFKTLYMG